MRHLGIEQTIKAEGQTFRLSRFTRRLLRLWFEWADGFLGNPLAIAEEHFGTFPEPDVLIGVASDLMTHRYSFNDPAVWHLWNSPDGVRQAFGLLLDKYHSEIDPTPIIDSLGLARVERLLALANGVPPVDVAEIERQYFASLGLLPETEPAPFRTMDWAEFDASLFQNLHLTPDQIDAMTPTEITVLCRKLDEANGRSLTEAAEVAKLYAKLTPEQILHLARLKAAH
jgi:hypothetical protein